MKKPNFLYRIAWSSLLAVTILCGGCYALTFIPTPPPPNSFAPNEFPKTDIIFNAGGKLGFINADGSQETYIPYQPFIKSFLGAGNISGWSRPLLTGNDMYLITTNGNDGGFPGGWGTIYVAGNGKPAVMCKEWGTGYVWVSADQEYLYMNNESGISKHLPSDCGTNNKPIKIFSDVQGPISPDERFVVIVKYEKTPIFTPHINIVELITGEETLITIGASFRVKIQRYSS